MIPFYLKLSVDNDISSLDNENILRDKQLLFKTNNNDSKISLTDHNIVVDDIVFDDNYLTFLTDLTMKKITLLDSLNTTNITYGSITVSDITFDKTININELISDNNSSNSIMCTTMYTNFINSTHMNILGNTIIDNITVNNIIDTTIRIGNKTSNVYISNNLYDETDMNRIYNIMDSEIYNKKLYLNTIVPGSDFKRDIGNRSGINIGNGYIKTSDDSTKFLFKIPIYDEILTPILVDSDNIIKNVSNIINNDLSSYNLLGETIVTNNIISNNVYSLRDIYSKYIYSDSVQGIIAIIDNTLLNAEQNNIVNCNIMNVETLDVNDINTIDINCITNVSTNNIYAENIICNNYTLSNNSSCNIKNNFECVELNAKNIHSKYLNGYNLIANDITVTNESIFGAINCNKLFTKDISVEYISCTNILQQIASSTEINTITFINGITVTSTNINPDYISSNNITVSNNITANTITSSALICNNITANSINVNKLYANTIKLNNEDIIDTINNINSTSDNKLIITNIIDNILDNTDNDMIILNNFKLNNNVNNNINSCFESNGIECINIAANTLYGTNYTVQNINIHNCSVNNTIVDISDTINKDNLNTNSKITSNAVILSSNNSEISNNSKLLTNTIESNILKISGQKINIGNQDNTSAVNFLGKKINNYIINNVEFNDNLIYINSDYDGNTNNIINHGIEIMTNIVNDNIVNIGYIRIDGRIDDDGSKFDDYYKIKYPNNVNEYKILTLTNKSDLQLDKDVHLNDLSVNSTLTISKYSTYNLYGHTIYNKNINLNNITTYSVSTSDISCTETITMSQLNVTGQCTLFNTQIIDNDAPIYNNSGYNNLLITKKYIDEICNINHAYNNKITVDANGKINNNNDNGVNINTLSTQSIIINNSIINNVTSNTITADSLYSQKLQSTNINTINITGNDIICENITNINIFSNDINLGNLGIIDTFECNDLSITTLNPSNIIINNDCIVNDTMNVETYINNNNFTIYGYFNCSHVTFLNETNNIHGNMTVTNNLTVPKIDVRDVKFDNFHAENLLVTNNSNIYVSDNSILKQCTVTSNVDVHNGINVGSAYIQKIQNNDSSLGNTIDNFHTLTKCNIIFDTGTITSNLNTLNATCKDLIYNNINTQTINGNTFSCTHMTILNTLTIENIKCDTLGYTQDSFGICDITELSFSYLLLNDLKVNNVVCTNNNIFNNNIITNTINTNLNINIDNFVADNITIQNNLSFIDKSNSSYTFHDVFFNNLNISNDSQFLNGTIHTVLLHNNLTTTNIIAVNVLNDNDVTCANINCNDIISTSLQINEDMYANNITTTNISSNKLLINNITCTDIDTLNLSISEIFNITDDCNLIAKNITCNDITCHNLTNAGNIFTNNILSNVMTTINNTCTTNDIIVTGPCIIKNIESHNIFCNSSSINCSNLISNTTFSCLNFLQVNDNIIVDNISTYNITNITDTCKFNDVIVNNNITATNDIYVENNFTCNNEISCNIIKINNDITVFENLTLSNLPKYGDYELAVSDDNLSVFSLFGITGETELFIKIYIRYIYLDIIPVLVNDKLLLPVGSKITLEYVNGLVELKGSNEYSPDRDNSRSTITAIINDDTIVIDHDTSINVELDTTYKITYNIYDIYGNFATTNIHIKIDTGFRKFVVDLDIPGTTYTNNNYVHDGTFGTAGSIYHITYDAGFNNPNNNSNIIPSYRLGLANDPKIYKITYEQRDSESIKSIRNYNHEDAIMLSKNFLNSVGYDGYNINSKSFTFMYKMKSASATYAKINFPVIPLNYYFNDDDPTIATQPRHIGEHQFGGGHRNDFYYEDASTFFKLVLTQDVLYIYRLAGWRRQLSEDHGEQFNQLKADITKITYTFNIYHENNVLFTKTVRDIPDNPRRTTQLDRTDFINDVPNVSIFKEILNPTEGYFTKLHYDVSKHKFYIVIYDKEGNRKIEVIVNEVNLQTLMSYKDLIPRTAISQNIRSEVEYIIPHDIHNNQTNNTFYEGVVYSQSDIITDIPSYFPTKSNFA